MTWTYQHASSIQVNFIIHNFRWRTEELSRPAAGCVLSVLRQPRAGALCPVWAGLNINQTTGSRGEIREKLPADSNIWQRRRRLLSQVCLSNSSCLSSCVWKFTHWLLCSSCPPLWFNSLKSEKIKRIKLLKHPPHSGQQQTPAISGVVASQGAGAGRPPAAAGTQL